MDGSDRSEIAQSPWDRAQVELEDACHRYLEGAKHPFAFSHVTAARLHGLATPRRLERDPTLDVSVNAQRHQPRRKGIRGHRTSATERVTLRGLPVVPPVTAWLQLAPILTVDELVIAGDVLVRRKRPMATMSELLAAVNSLAGGRGATTARAALELIRPGTDSPMETRMRLAVVHAGLPEPLVGYTIRDIDGTPLGTPDLALPDLRIAMEYEGRVHDDLRVFEADIERYEVFAEHHWRTIRVTKRHLLPIPALFVARVIKAIAERAAEVRP